MAAVRGAKHDPRISKEQHEVTVVACASATGNILPSVFIFKKLNSRVCNRVQEGAPAGSLFVAQKSGWIDKDMFMKWSKEVFLKFIPSKRPALLIIYGHKAHVTLDVIELTTGNKILVFCLTANASHLLQALDLCLVLLRKVG